MAPRVPWSSGTQLRPALLGMTWAGIWPLAENMECNNMLQPTHPTVRPSLPVALTLEKLVRSNDEMVTLWFPRPEAEDAAGRGLDLSAFVPGRFFMLWLPRLDEKPYAVSYLDEERLAITAQVRGPFSKALAELQPGAKVGLRGPFGRGFWDIATYGDSGRAALIGGGCGTAVIAPLASAIPTATAVQGARSANVVLNLPGLEGQIIFTDDGSAGRKGFPTEWLEEKMQMAELDIVYTCGPEVMMYGVAEICRAAGIACQVCLERYMKCGIGVCGQCECDGRRVCVEGPVFDLSDLADMPSFGRSRRDKTGAVVVPDACPAGPGAASSG
jgi:dihydroorotate dehydrogenase electron transfer subunit